MKRHIYLLGCLVFVWAKVSYAQSSKTFSVPIEAISVTASETSSIQEAKELTFKPLQNFSAFAKDQTYWFQIRLDSGLIPDAEYALRINNVYTSYFEVFEQIDEKWQTHKTGYEIDPVFRDLPNFSHTVHLRSRGAKEQILYCRVRNIGGHLVSGNFEIVPFSQIQAKEKEIAEEKDLQLFFQGILWIMILYNLCIFLMSRDRAYLFYTLYLLGTALYLLHRHFYPVFSDTGNLYWHIASAVTAFLYINYFLFLKNFDTNYLKPFQHKIIHFLIAFEMAKVLVGWGILLFFYHIPTAQIQLNAFRVISNLFTIYLLFSLLRNPKWSYRYFSIGSLILFLTSLALPLVILIDHATVNFFIYRIFQYGILIEILLFSLSLGYRLSDLNTEKQQIKEELIQQLKENELLQTQVNRELEQKVRERTQEIRNQKEKIEYQNEEIMVQNEELRQQQEEITSQMYYIEEKNAELSKQNLRIMDSIRYALTIQQAILPPEQKMHEAFIDHFVIYLPKDVVSGDFYWLYKQQNEIYFALVDCTGHGVPGAMMSMVAHSQLNSLVVQDKINEPDEILHQLDRAVNRTLKQRNTKKLDGMDMSLVRLQKNEEEKVWNLSFAGAKMPLYCFSKNNLQIINPTRLSIGGYSIQEKYFEKQNVQFSSNTLLYFCSDGYIDQPNRERKKIGSWGLRNTLQQIGTWTLAEQKGHLEGIIAEQLYESEQRDDISLIGLFLG